MKVLLVEDEPHKVLDLKKRLRSFYGDNLDLAVCGGVSAAVDAVYNDNYDLLILDMALPTFSEPSESGGVQQAVGGVEVLRALKAFSRSCVAIVVTQYPDILLNGESVQIDKIPERLQRLYGVRVLAAILYSYSAQEWEGEFLQALENTR